MTDGNVTIYVDMRAMRVVPWAIAATERDFWRAGMGCIIKFWVRGFFALAIFFGVLNGNAQEFRATLTGQVTDSSGAVIKGANVKAVNTDTKTTYTAVTTARGDYYIPYVLPGTYTVTVSSGKFKTAVQEKVLMLASQVFNQNFSLQVGSVTDQVVVSSAPPQLETEDASGNNTIGSREIENVPLNGGQIYSLIGTTPGSQPTYAANTQLNGYNAQNSYTIGGGIVGNNQFTLNGSNITSQYTYDNQGAGEWTISPNMDSIQELNVMTTTYDARYGRTSGGTVNSVSKSGTNQYHATARYAFEGTTLNANSYQNNLVGSPRNGEVQNQFWITAGGPIIKNRLFAFFGFEGFRQSLASSLVENVAPAYLRPGYNGNAGVDFGLAQTMDPVNFPNGFPIFEPGTGVCLAGGPVTSCDSNKIAQTEFPNDTIPASLINPTALAILKFLPLPNIAGAENLVSRANFFAQNPGLLHYNQPQIRVDYNLTDRTKLYSYFIYSNGAAFQDGNGLTGLALNGTVNAVHQTWVATQDVTHVFSPTLTGDFKVSYDRFYETSPDGINQPTNPSTIGLTMPLPATTSTEFLPQFSIVDGWNSGFLGGNGNPTIFGNSTNPSITNNYTLNIDFTKTHGAHTIEFGGEIDEYQFGGFPDGGGNPNGQFNYGSSFTQYDPQNANCYSPTGVPNSSCNTLPSNQNGSALATFYLGYPGGNGVNNSHIDWIGSIMEGYPVYAGYFQDNWRVSRKMTLNLGIRYDVQRGLRERHNNLNRGLCLTCINPIGNQASYQANIANAANNAAWAAAGIDTSSLSTVMGGIQFPGVDGQSRDAYDTDWSDVGPRFGFAYQIDAKTVIRGGYGIMYSYGLEGGSSVGETQSTNYTASLDGGNTPTGNFNSGNPFASGLLAPTGNSLGLETDLGNGGVQVDFPQRKIPIEQILSLGFQRELSPGLVLDARYAGNFTKRLRTFLWTNGTASLAQEQQAVANPNYFNQQVPNPFYGVPGISGPGQCGTSTTIPAIDLRTILPQYCSPGGTGLVGEYNAPIGGNFYNALEVKLNKRVSGGAGRGLSFQISYTWSKTINEDGYLNGWPYQDLVRIHQLADNDRTHVLAITSVYNLPFGRGGLVWTHPSQVVDALIGGWVLGGVFTAESGTPVGVNTGWYYTCNQSYKPTGGSTLGHWFSTASDPSACWQGIPPYGLMNLTGRTEQVRNPTTPDLDLSLEKTVPIWNRVNFTLRLDAFNATNSVLFGGPDTNPGDGAASYTVASHWSGFGTVGPNQQNTPRVLQIQGKVTF
jgi:Carboxypeptidase regulatory-like domain